MPKSKIADMTSVVMIGRRMKSSGMLMIDQHRAPGIEPAGSPAPLGQSIADAGWRSRRFECSSHLGRPIPWSRAVYHFCSDVASALVDASGGDAGLKLTLAPGTRRNCPSVTTVSPGFTPAAMTVDPSMVTLVVTALLVTV